MRSEARWSAFSEAEQAQLTDLGWKAPSFDTMPNAGIDFLYMHRRMIEMVDNMLDTIGDTSYPKVAGWRDIPWEHDDPVWTMPPAWNDPDPDTQDILKRTKSIAYTEFYRNRVAREFTNREWLRSVSLDQLGSELGFSIHGWMHLHWSTSPPADPNTSDSSNDWLGSPFSSHVNKHFWKLHGWIDDRISAWEDANGQIADISNGWEGAPGFFPDRPHTADPELFVTLNVEDRPLLLMPWADRLLEGHRQ